LLRFYVSALYWFSLIRFVVADDEAVKHSQNLFYVMTYELI